MEHLLRLPLEEIEAGFALNQKRSAYACLVCGREFEIGEIFPANGRYYDARRAVRLHIGEEHGDMLSALAAYGKKYTGITENQKELLMMMAQGLTDKEIAQQNGSSPSTVRHQRFVLREKARQAKLYLALFGLAQKGAEGRKADADEKFAEIHPGAKMVDDRYFVTREEEEKILAGAFSSLNPPVLRAFSPKEKKKLVILRKIASLFEHGRRYTEKEVNAVLAGVYGDYATLRRYLIEYGFMERTNDCGEYWLI